MKTLYLLLLNLMAINSYSADNVNFLDYAFAKANWEPPQAIISKQLESPSKRATPTIRVALLLDTSNSMDGLIDQARSQLWELVNELSYARCTDANLPDLQIALYEYGNDALDAREGYMRQVNSFSSDLDELSKNLYALTTNGGNEYCGYVLQSSLQQLDWGNNSEDLNLIFIAGNEPFDQGPVAYTTVSEKACANKVTINTIFCGNYNLGVQSHWKDGASLTSGTYIAINSDKSTVHLASPYDAELLQKNKALNNTYVGYGALAESKMQLQATQDKNAASKGDAGAVKRVISKTSRFYNNSTWDLVDAIGENEEVLEEISTTDLPASLRGKTNAQRKAFLATKKAERASIKKSITELTRKRQDYLAQNTSQGSNALSTVLLEAIKKQGNLKGYIWE